MQAISPKGNLHLNQWGAQCATRIFMDFPPAHRDNHQVW